MISTIHPTTATIHFTITTMSPMLATSYYHFLITKLSMTIARLKMHPTAITMTSIFLHSFCTFRVDQSNSATINSN